MMPKAHLRPHLHRLIAYLGITRRLCAIQLVFSFDTRFEKTRIENTCMV